MNRKTAGKYLKQDNVLETRRAPHTWKTRKDPLAMIWPKAQEMLQDAPELEAKALFEHLMPGGAGTAPEEKHLRTFQRRVREWRLGNGPGKEVFFTQDQTPGKVLAMDWTDMGGLGITIGGLALKHSKGQTKYSIHIQRDRQNTGLTGGKICVTWLHAQGEMVGGMGG